MKKNLVSKLINNIADLIELIVAIVLSIVIITLLIEMILDVHSIGSIGAEFEFNYFLTRALNLIIGIEFIRMICKHTPDTIVEVLMFATARHLLVNQSTSLDTFLSVVSIGVLFLIKKFLLFHDPEEEGDFIKELFKKRKNKEADDLN